MEPFRSRPGSQTAIFLAGCILSCLLQLVSAQKNLIVVSEPQCPMLGQAAFLYSKDIREGFQYCNWTEPDGSSSSFGDPQKVVINNVHTSEMHQNCTYVIRNLKPSSQGRYTVQVIYPPTKQSAAKETFIGSVYLTVCDSSGPIKNSAGRIAGALLGSLTWTSILTLVPLLFGILSPSFPKC